MKNLNIKEGHTEAFLLNFTMDERLKEFIKVILMLGICIAGITLVYKCEHKDVPPAVIIPPPQDTIPAIPDFMNKSAEEGLMEALEYYDIHHPEIVYAQAVLETGHFKSKGCTVHNNLFGLYNSKAGRYHRFDHWTDGVIAYKEWIQRRYKHPEDYYYFLQRIGYAEDSAYSYKLKRIVNSK